MIVVAGAVKVADCLDALCGLGCDVIQCWHTGRPMTDADFAVAI
jgi:EAL domain-containing protein (putative c-di-GMP-specific phosphodiesterase class I)